MLKRKKTFSVRWGFGDIRLVLTAAKFSPAYCMLGIKMTHTTTTCIPCSKPSGSRKCLSSSVLMKGKQLPANLYEEKKPFF